MVVHGCSLLYIVVHSCTPLYMVVYVCTWLYMFVHGCICLYMVLQEYTLFAGLSEAYFAAQVCAPQMRPVMYLIAPVSIINRRGMEVSKIPPIGHGIAYGYVQREGSSIFHRSHMPPWVTSHCHFQVNFHLLRQTMLYLLG